MRFNASSNNWAYMGGHPGVNVQGNYPGAPGQGGSHTILV
jgi:hypothetical protein